jgi:hypothetical protein
VVDSDLLETVKPACKGVDSVNDRKPSKPRSGGGTWVLLVCLVFLTNLTQANAQEPTDLPSGRAADSENPSSGPSVVPGGQGLGVLLSPEAFTSRALRRQPRLLFADESQPALPQPQGMPEGLESAFQTLRAGRSPRPDTEPGQGFPLTQPSTNTTDAGPEPSKPADERMSAKTADDDFERAGCSTCGGFHSSTDGSIFHNSITGGTQCVPGQEACDPPDGDTIFGALISNVYQILNCKDPCYEPTWEPGAYASVFVDYARPRTVTRFRYDNLQDMTIPDRNTYFLSQTQPSFPSSFTNRHGVPYRTDPSVYLQQGYYYQEVAAGRGSFFMEVPYRSVNPLFSPGQAGFSDINFGIKTMWVDSELWTLSFQFRTYTPSGDASHGLGSGHFSLDPSLLSSVKLAPDTYLQTQLGNWIPLAGNPQLSGGIFYFYNSLNQVLWRITPDIPIIGMLEMDGWSFENGGYTIPIKRPHYGSIAERAIGGVDYFNIGPGLRVALGKAVDVGGALTWATTANHWASPWFRLEVRFLF